MKIAVDASALTHQRTGVGNYIFALLVELVKDTSYQFYLYSNQDISFPERANVHLRVSRPYRKGPLWQNTQLRSMVSKDQPDIFWGGNGYLPLGLPKKTATVLTVHDLVYRQAGATMPWFSRWSRRIFQPLAVKLATKTVAVSEATASEMVQHYSRRPDLVIHPQVDAQYMLVSALEVDQTRVKYQLERPYVLVLGTLEPRKNLPALIKAWMTVAREGVELPLLAIAGGKGWLEDELSALVTQGETQGLIKKLGYVDQQDMRGLYAGADAFILPSLYEGFGMPVLESQLCGTPAMIANIPSLKEASGGVACTFEPNELGIAECLRHYAKAQLPLACRLPYTINNNAANASKELELLFKQAIEVKAK